MDKVTKFRRQLSADRWLQIIQEQRQSDLTVKQWCKEHGYCPSTFYKYLKLQREKVIDSLPVAVGAQAPAQFAQLQLPSEDKTTSQISKEIVITLATAKISIPNGTDPVTIAAVLKALC